MQKWVGVFLCLVVPCLGVLSSSGCKASTKSLSDTGFDVTRDGFAFSNFSDTSTGIDADAMVRLFGASVACTNAATPCVLTGPATSWMGRANALLALGRCEGFSILGQLIQSKAISASTFGGAEAHALTFSDTLAKELAYWQSTQLLAPEGGETRQLLTGTDAVTYFENELKPNSGKLFRIGMVNVKDGAQVGAHSVMPIGVEQASAKNQFFIRVYDSNLPGTEQRITVDTSANTWAYTAVNHAGGPSVVLSGDKTGANPLYVWTATPHLGTYECPFCDTTPSGGSVITVSGLTVTDLDFPGATATLTPLFLTNFGALFCQNDCGGVPTASGKIPAQGLYVDVAAGAIVLANPAGSQGFTAGQFGFVASPNSPPVVVPPAQGVQVLMPTSISGTMTVGRNGSQVKADSCLVQRDVGSFCDSFVAPPPSSTAPKKPLPVCTRRDAATPIGSTTFHSDQVLADGSSETVEVTFPAGMTSAALKKGSSTPGRDPSPFGPVSACGSSPAPFAASVSAGNSATGAVIQGTIIVPADATIDLDPTQAQSGQPLVATVTTPDGAQTTAYIPDDNNPDVTAPTPGTALAVTAINHSQARLTWGAAIDPDNTLTPAPPLSYKIVWDTNAANVATVATADAETNVALDYSAEVTSTLVTGLPAGVSVTFAVLVKDVAGNRALYNTVSATTAAGNVIFRTQATTSGAMGGIAGADALCAADTSKPGLGTFKALLVDGVNRIACTSANCATSGLAEHTDWVLSPLTTYATAAGLSLGTTDANGLFSSALSTPIYTLPPLDDSPNQPWTGLQIDSNFLTDWLSDANNCLIWSQSANGTGAGGFAGSTSSAFSTPAEDDLSCSSSAAIYCVEQ